MSELKELLAAEAARQQPTHQPPFADLVRSRRRRDRRAPLLAGALIALALTAAGVPALMRQERTAPSAPSAGVPVTGTLLQVGGPGGIPPRGIAGTVHFQATDGTVTEVLAKIDGRFSLSVPPGRYVATGTPRGHGTSNPSSVFVSNPPEVPTGNSSGAVTTIPDGARLPVCEADAPITVSSGGLDDVQVICQVR
ncbi:hypothetical protein [Dactylosporangium sp. NPDC005555]|uniref:hypothetical protein n=1 Tax=Dactylosporangium sp. NPDC005555 TaxID=3154889 RepID=UPI0033BF2A88